MYIKGLRGAGQPTWVTGILRAMRSWAERARVELGAGAGAR